MEAKHFALVKAKQLMIAAADQEILGKALAAALLEFGIRCSIEAKSARETQKN